MNTRLLTLLALPCVALALSAPAQAQSAPDRMPMPHGAPMHHMGQDFFAQLDANHDGKVTREELKEFGDRMFAQLDRNHDGVITRDEMPRHGGPMNDAMGEPMGRPMKHHMWHCEMPSQAGGPAMMQMQEPVDDGAPGFAQGRPDDPSYKLWTAAPAPGYDGRAYDMR